MNWRAAGAFAALFALLLHAFAVQTHVHTLGAPLEIHAAAPEGGNADHAIATAPHDAACFVCETLASSGRVTLATAAALTAPASAAIAATRISIPDPPRALTHTWRSRAPPTAL